MPGHQHRHVWIQSRRTVGTQRRRHTRRTSAEHQQCRGKPESPFPAGNLSDASLQIFGDPDDGQAVGDIPQDKVKIFCDPFDNICQGGALILPAHLSYAKHAQQAAEFVVQHAEA